MKGFNFDEIIPALKVLFIITLVGMISLGYQGCALVTWLTRETSPEVERVINAVNMILPPGQNAWVGVIDRVDGKSATCRIQGQNQQARHIRTEDPVTIGAQVLVIEEGNTIIRCIPVH